MVLEPHAKKPGATSPRAKPLPKEIFCNTKPLAKISPRIANRIERTKR